MDADASVNLAMTALDSAFTRHPVNSSFPRHMVNSRLVNGKLLWSIFRPIVVKKYFMSREGMPIEP